MANPMIVYDSGAGPTTLNLQQLPRHAPAYMYEAIRHDNVASSGVRESVTERIDRFFQLEMEYVAAGPDVSNWAAFMQYALGGGQFSYYSDSAETSFTNCWLEDTSWTAEYKSAGQYTFSLKLRQAVI